MQVSSTPASSYSPPAQAGPASAKPISLKPDDPVADFLAYANMTPAQKMRAAILGSMGLTEDKVAQMDPKDRAKVEDKIKELIKEKVQEATEKKTGVAIDLKV
jgi:hypothetical protein